MNAPTEKLPLGVYASINAVQKALSKTGITKDRKNQQQGYSFRGIDDVYNALSPLLAEHGLCILPRILTRNCEERQTQKGGVLFYVTVEAEFDFVAASDGSRHVVRTFGEAMDSADKATNKAMSAAYKYAAFQAFAIPTEGDNDADAHTPQQVAPKGTITPTTGLWEALDEENRAFLTEIAMNAIALLTEGNPSGAVEYIKKQNLDADDMAAIWTRFDSKQRSAMKKVAKPTAEYYATTP